MWFLWLVSWVSLVLQVLFATMSLAAGLFYLSELVEEYTSYAAVAIRYCVLVSSALCVCYWLLAGFDAWLVACCLAAQFCHFLLLTNFPLFNFGSPQFVGACVFNVLHHYLAFKFFGDNYFAFQEVISYFVLCGWLVPMCLLVSLTANDHTLPTVAGNTSGAGGYDGRMEGEPLLYGSGSGGGDYVSHYMSGRSRSRWQAGSSYKQLLQSIKHALLPAASAEHKRFS